MKYRSQSKIVYITTTARALQAAISLRMNGAPARVAIDSAGTAMSAITKDASLLIGLRT